MLAILLFGIFVVQFRHLQPSTISPDNLNTHVCMQQDGTMTCCTSYYQTQYGCKPCIGATGLNCSTPCPDNYFGAKCMDRCECSTDECDKELGCYKDYQTTTDDDDTETQPPSTLHRTFPKKSLLVWTLVICGAIMTVLLFLIVVILLKSRTKRKQKRQQNLFSSTTEINNSIDEMNKSASCIDYINNSFQPKLGDSGHI